MYIKRGVELGLIVVVVAIVAVIGLFFEGGITGAVVGVNQELAAPADVLEIDAIKEDNVEIAADCAAWPCDCGDTLTASVTMTGNLEGCGLLDGDFGLKIGANDVTLDCATYEIGAKAQGNIPGIYNHNYTGFTMKNCVINGFRTESVLINNASGIKILNSTFTNDSNQGNPTILIANSEYGVIDNVTIVNNTRDSNSNDGITFDNSSHFNITNSLFKNISVGYPINFNAGSNATHLRIINNRFENLSSSTASKKLPINYESTSNVRVASHHTIANNTFNITYDFEIDFVNDSIFINNTFYTKLSITGENLTFYNNDLTTRGLSADSINNSNISSNRIRMLFDIKAVRESIFEKNIINDTPVIIPAGSQNLTLRSNTINNPNSTSKAGIDAISTNNITIDNNTIVLSHYNNLIYVRGAPNTIITNNNLNGSTAEAIKIRDLNGSNISGNTISNASDGISFKSHSLNQIVTQNTITNVTDAIIFFGPGRNNTVSNNTIYNVTNGIHLQMAGGPYANFTVYGNSISGSNIAMRLEHISESNFSSNRIFNNSFGFRMANGDDTLQVQYNVFEDNKLLSNTVGYELHGPTQNNNYTLEKITGSVDGIRAIRTAFSGGDFIENRWYNSNFSNNTYDVNITYGGGSIYFINTTDNNLTANAYASQFYVKWYTFVNVTDSSGSALPDVNITGFDATGVVDDYGVSDSNGLLRLALTEYFIEDRTTYFTTQNHTIQATRNGFNTNQSIINLIAANSHKVNLTLTNQTCGTTVTTDLTLGVNLSGTASCLHVGADNIKINGNGYTLIGSGNGIGVNISGYDGVVIENLTIQNFTRSVDIYDGKHAVFRNIVARNSSYLFIFNDTENISVYDSDITNGTLGNVVATGSKPSNISLVNITMSPSNITAGSAHVAVKWYVDVNATYNTNLTLVNGNASGHFNITNGRLDDSRNTDNNGSARLELTELIVNSSGITYLTPHNISLRYNSLTTATFNITSLNLTKTNNTQVNLSIKLNCTTPAIGLNISGNTTLCPGRFTAHSMTLGTFKSNVTCDRTTLIGDKSGFGINVTGNNITIRDCVFKDHGMAINFHASYEYLNITNNTLRDCGTGSYEGCVLLSGDKAQVAKNEMRNGKYGIFVNQSSNHTISFNNMTNMSAAYYVWLAGDSTVFNNTFSDGKYGIYSKPNPNRNLFYHNTVEGMSSQNIFSLYNANLQDDFNTTIAGTFQGNKWDDYCDKGQDTNDDGYADNVSSVGDDYPYNATISTKVFDWLVGKAVDYHPFIFNCTNTVFLGSSAASSSSSDNSDDGGGSALAAPEVAAPEKEDTPTEYGSAAEVAEDLETTIIVEDFDELVTIKVTLENTGTKTMRLFPEILQSVEDPFFIVTKKTLGFAGSLFSKLSFIWYSGNTISGRLLEAEIVNPEQIVLQPGEKIEKELQIKEGLSVPRQIKIQFTTFGETVLEEDISEQFNEREKAVSGTAVDVDKDNNLIDVYAVIFPSQLSDAFEERLDSAITGATVGINTKKSNTYFIELNVNSKMERKMQFLPGKFSFLQTFLSSSNKVTSTFSDLYGPYIIAEDQALVFAQQMEYNKDICEGNYDVKARIYQEDEIVVENEFDVELC